MSLPPEFRAKHNQLLYVIDSRTGKPVTDSLGAAQRLEPHSSGGARFIFGQGSLYSFDHTGRYPCVAVWGSIFRYFDSLANFNGGFGRPLTDITDLPDGGLCCIFEGGHLHQYGEKVEPFPESQCVARYKPAVPPFPFGIGPGGMPYAFHQKWMSLSLQKDTNGDSIIQHLSLPCHRLNENPNGGQNYHFLGGTLLTLDNHSPVVLCYGGFRALWDRVGGLGGGFGHPLSDPQAIEGGRCQVFQGGHIHAIGDSVQTCSPDKCKRSNQVSFPSGNGMPPHFQRKWTALCSVIHPHTRAPIAEMLGVPCHRLHDNPDNIPGQSYHFLQGQLVSLSRNPEVTPFSTPPTTTYDTPNYPFQQNAYSGYPQGAASGTMPYGAGYGPPSYPGGVEQSSPYGPHPGMPQYIPGLAPHGGGRPFELTEPFYVTGVIATFWNQAGGVTSTYGRPLCDEQDLPDGGRCAIFEGAHIHLYQGEARGVAAQFCTAPYQPTAPASHNLAAWPSQPGPQPSMAVPPAQTGQTAAVDNKEDGCCMALLKFLCSCSVEYTGRGGVCKCADCVCCTWTVS